MIKESYSRARRYEENKKKRMLKEGLIAVFGPKSKSICFKSTQNKRNSKLLTATVVLNNINDYTCNTTEQDISLYEYLYTRRHIILLC